ncbi:MAG TPA: ABC transporter substrate-binding protein [Methylophaga sp.]|jgi:hypothetical protein|uniref:hypothetical protein n=1 Tax=unclassified Methylophaga TaxID=2629249 RepID=UPI000C9131CC|nr:MULTISPECIES: hypothetical protein [unclassified Methylophaga]MAP26128.1 ABC transporter substrate-binding protein [Methylophaga sp.]HAD30785.1 ABC transporter substrate-binding protein [Methylophaga sp.]HCO01545.1 ABC transporter substrate-binding protein [Methylophaga sp.]|tara:strand:- start:371 stop:1126 length:756 start_codon:yes stop_codon:yes gene_type:complete
MLPTKAQRWYIGIDDTDNIESRGTGFHARSLGAAINNQQLGRCRFITRHQLLMSPLVPFTSHNSAACLVIEQFNAPVRHIEKLCVEYLLNESAEGADVGLCIASEQQLSMAMLQFGFICKQRLVTQQQARDLARQYNVILHGLTGTEDGVIGALAAVNLCGSGVDGRLLWLPGMRDHVQQTLSLSSLLDLTDITVVQDRQGKVLTDPVIQIAMGSWPRAIWLGGEATLIVEPDEETPNEWKVAEKSYLKQF